VVHVGAWVLRTASAAPPAAIEQRQIGNVISEHEKESKKKK
jgi:hypothetical protein